jgi:hypothetical protein
MPHAMRLLWLLPAALLTFLAISLRDPATTQLSFVNTTYYFSMATLLCWVGTHLHAARGWRGAAILRWLRENWPGVAVAALVTLTVGLAVEPALRMLSDEANLVGTSKNLFASKTATFTVSGKNYYDSYWDVDVAIDQRPTLFPFLVSLVHAAVGYSYRNAFHFNLLILPAFLLVSYRLAKSLGGETFAVVAALLVAAHPITLLTARSGGFDFLANFFALLVLKSLLDFNREANADRLAVLWMNLAMFAGIRYESALFIAPVLALLLAFKLVDRSMLRAYVFIYAATPAFFLPRIWQSVLRGNVPAQDPGTVAVSFQNFLANVSEYFRPIFEPTVAYPAHSGLLIGLGVIGCLSWARRLRGLVREHGWRAPQARFAIFAFAWMLLQAIITFSYFWGRAQYPSAARLVIAFDTFFSFAAAWISSVWLARARPFVPMLLAAALLVFQLPVASQHRMLNRLTQTRESATCWRYFERLGEKRILIVTDRPSHFTIMDYGAINFEGARRDPYLLSAFARHLFYDIYVIQPIQLSTNQPLAGYELWPNRRLETVLEFQNDADALVRISRLAH